MVKTTSYYAIKDALYMLDAYADKDLCSIDYNTDTMILKGDKYDLQGSIGELVFNRYTIIVNGKEYDRITSAPGASMDPVTAARRVASVKDSLLHQLCCISKRFRRSDAVQPGKKRAIITANVWSKGTVEEQLASLKNTWALETTYYPILQVGGRSSKEWILKFSTNFNSIVDDAKGVSLTHLYRDGKPMLAYEYQASVGNTRRLYIMFVEIDYQVLLSPFDVCLAGGDSKATKEIILNGRDAMSLIASENRYNDYAYL